MGVTRARRCDRKRERLYRNKFRWLTTCVYCGQDATTVDHVLPISLAPDGVHVKSKLARWQFGQGLNRVPCCHECNAIANDRLFLWIREKRQFIQRELERRYSKALRAPIWDEDDFEDMGHALKTHIIREQRNLARAELRINYPSTKTRVEVFQ